MLVGIALRNGPTGVNIMVDFVEYMIVRLDFVSVCFEMKFYTRTQTTLTQWLSHRFMMNAGPRLLAGLSDAPDAGICASCEIRSS